MIVLHFLLVILFITASVSISWVCYKIGRQQGFKSGRNYVSGPPPDIFENNDHYDELFEVNQDADLGTKTLLEESESKSEYRVVPLSSIKEKIYANREKMVKKCVELVNAGLSDGKRTIEYVADIEVCGDFTGEVRGLFEDEGYDVFIDVPYPASQPNKKVIKVSIPKNVYR